jgi:hypothetical protein
LFRFSHKVEKAKSKSVARWLIRMTEAVQKAKIDEQVNECVLVGDGCAVAEVGALDAEGGGLSVDALDGGALVVDEFVFL